MAHIRAMKEMIKIIKTYDESISDGVLWAVQQVPRHKFIKEKGAGYLDTPLDIGYGQTISQPFIVAYMTDMLDIGLSHTVLEIGTGSGYQAAVLSEVALRVYTVERIKALADQTKILLEHYSNVHMKTGNGYKGWKKNAPYDRIIVTAMPDYIPRSLVNQLKDGGKMIIPVQGILVLVTKTGETYTKKELIGVRFVPLVNEV